MRNLLSCKCQRIIYSLKDAGIARFVALLRLYTCLSGQNMHNNPHVTRISARAD